MMSKQQGYYAIFLGILIVGLMLLIYTKNSSPDDPCEIHRNLFEIKIDSGRVQDKYVDRDNHAMKTVIISSEGKSYKLLFIAYRNWEDFDKIEINDVISKPGNSFSFKINNEFQFNLRLDCEYSNLVDP